MAWLLAKTWVRSSDFQLHQLQSHLLRGHLIAEVIAVATMRSLPSLHPIYKVLQHLCHSVFDCPSYFRLLHGVSPCIFQSSSNQFICGDTHTHIHSTMETPRHTLTMRWRGESENRFCKGVEIWAEEVSRWASEGWNIIARKINRGKERKEHG